MKAILYCRVDGPINSFTMDAIRAQQKMLLDYAQVNNMEVEQIYTDIGCPGTTLERIGLQSLIQAMQKGSADVILVVSHSRLFRGLLPPALKKLPVIAVKERDVVLEQDEPSR